jgi:hypothetical protein
MRSGTTHLTERARSIFDQLGYDVDGRGSEFRAEREWKSVRVSTVSDVKEPPQSGDLRCFVTYRNVAHDLRGRLLDDKPPYDWAIIAIGEPNAATDCGYDVIHPEDVVR